MNVLPQALPEAFARALDHFRRGELAPARAGVEHALQSNPDSPPLLAFAGMLAAEAGDRKAAISCFRRLHEIAPGDPANRVNLASALLAAGELDEAGSVCEGAETDPRLLRIAAYVHQERGRLAKAIAGYEKVVAAVPDDFESWNNLGNARAGIGDLDAAIAAFQQAIGLRPDIPSMYLNLSDVLALAERHEARQAVMREAARVAPSDPQVQAELGLAEAALQNFAAAEKAFREAIRLSPGFTSAYLDLGLLLENLNRVDELGALVAEAEERGLTEGELNLVKAWSLRRQGRFAEALPLAEATPESVNPVRRAQLLAELADRLGDTKRAFAAFEEMNRLSRAMKPEPDGPTYRARVADNAALLTAEAVAAWKPLDLGPGRPSPVFLVGFPRSGTTLLDTLLMNIPSLRVLEEMPILARVEQSLGGHERLAGIDSAEADALRRLYFDSADEIADSSEEMRLVDKHPLHMARAALIHRLFPDARIVLVERHPCDCVLSCFMANFELNFAMRSFTEIDEAARTYDTVFDAWTRAEKLLPIRVHRVRYERMVEDLEAEMRPLLEFLGIRWNPAVLDNRAAASSRGHIRTASYSQVTEPIYRRSKGRWHRYREQLAPVLSILAPWAERMGYEI